MQKLKIFEGDLFHSGDEDWKERAESIINDFIQSENHELVSVSFTINDSNESKAYHYWTAAVVYKG